MSRISELEQLINSARNAYYNGVASMSDQAYDALVAELTKLDPINSAVVSIGHEPVSGWSKYTHLVPMGSLNKCQTAEEYHVWHDRYVGDKGICLVTPKLDGLSVSLMYEAGKLVRAATRGSGTIGELITENVAKMRQVPLHLSQKIDVTVRGEIVLAKKTHQTDFKDYSNPRNAASGLSRRYDGVGSEKLSVLVYELISKDVNFEEHHLELQFLKELGFSVPPFYLCHKAESVVELHQEYQNSLRDRFDFELDGLVAQVNNLAKFQEYGSLRGRPYASIAYKFESETAETVVKNITVGVGNSGRLTPVVEFEPVELVGATITRASLYNFSYIQEIGLDVGARVLVSRANDVIPRCEAVLESTGSIFKTPTHCPSCNREVTMNGENLQCTNSSKCPAQIIGRLQNWIKVLDVLEWGEKLLARLVETGLVENIADLYRLSVEDLASVERMGEKSAANCLEQLWTCNPIGLNKLIGGLSIPLIGVSTVDLLIENGYDTLEKLKKLTYDDLLSIKGLGPGKALSLHQGLLDNSELIQDILDTGVEIKKPSVTKEPKIGKLSSKSICITGSTNIKRADLIRMIEEHGGNFKSSVTKDCTHLMLADPSKVSTKTKNASKLGVQIISEDQFLKWLE